MTSTARLGLPLIAASQSQKEVSHNEALAKLDTLAHLTILDRDLSAPPGSPSEGEAYLVGGGASGAWAGQGGNIAAYADGAWSFYAPFLGLLAFIADEETLAVYTALGWRDYAPLLTDVAILNQTASGAQSQMCTVEEELSGLSGAYVETTIAIPNRAVLWCVSSRTTTAITGASSYGCGISGEPTKFGGSLGIAEGSTNAGVIGPQAFYSDTKVRVTADGGNFSGGAVTLALHYLLPVMPGA